MVNSDRKEMDTKKYISVILNRNFSSKETYCAKFRHIGIENNVSDIVKSRRSEDGQGLQVYQKRTTKQIFFKYGRLECLCFAIGNSTSSIHVYKMKKYIM